MTAVLSFACSHTQIIWLCASSLGATAQAAGLPWPLACRACSGPGFEEGPDAGDGDADRVIAADRDADRLGGARHGMRVRAEAARAPGCPAPAACRAGVRFALDAATGGRNHATCVMACHADRR